MHCQPGVLPLRLLVAVAHALTLVGAHQHDASSYCVQVIVSTVHSVQVGKMRLQACLAEHPVVLKAAHVESQTSKYDRRTTRAHLICRHLSVRNSLRRRDSQLNTFGNASQRSAGLIRDLKVLSTH